MAIAYPNGLAVAAQQGTILITSNAVVGLSFAVPPNSAIVDVLIDPIVAVSTGSAYLRVGTGAGDGTYFPTGNYNVPTTTVGPRISVQQTASQQYLTAAQQRAWYNVGTNTTVRVELVPHGGTATVGEYQITLMYAHA